MELKRLNEDELSQTVAKHEWGWVINGIVVYNGSHEMCVRWEMGI